MSKYEMGDKVVMEITEKISVMGEPWDVLSDATSIYEPYLDKAAEPLSTYTEPLEAEIRRQAAEITRLLAENKRLKAENGNGLWNIEQARAEGQNEAWELARKIVRQPINGGYKRSEFEEIFSCGYISDIFEKFTYSEAAAKVAEWENEKEEIKDGDVLEGIYDNEVKCIVTNLCPDNMAYLVFDDGTAGVYELDNLKKTDRHIDIDSFLKQIGGEQE